MSRDDSSDPGTIRARAEEAYERYEFEAARVLYRALPGPELSRRDLENLLAVDRESMRLRLLEAWRETGSWFVGVVLAERSDAEEAVRMLSEILERNDLDLKDRWRVRMQRVDAVMRSRVTGPPPGLGWWEVAGEYLAAWRELDGVTTGDESLRRSMLAAAIVRIHGPRARDFVTALSSHPDLPSWLAPVVLAKRELFEAAAGIGSTASDPET